jgi:photosystem II stability/assembly factor-like uncharacterized protein
MRHFLQLTSAAADCFSLRKRGFLLQLTPDTASFSLRKRGFLLLTALFCSVTITRAQWTNQDAGFTNQILGFYEISIVDEDVVWAICYDGVGGLFGPTPILDFTRTTDGGATWTPGVMGTDSTLAFSTIFALSDMEAWVAMHKKNLTGGGGLFHTTDGGVTWDEAPGVFTSSSFPNFVYFKDALNGIAGGDATDGYFEIYTTTDGGVSWVRTPQSNVPAFATGGGYGWFDGFDVVGDTVWFGTSAGEMYKSTDFGLNWSVSTVSPAGYTVYEIAFNDNGQQGLTHVRSNTATYLFSTSDGGATWAQLPTHPDWKQSRITAVPGTDVFVSTSVINSNRGSAFSNDVGVTWTEIESTTPKAACRFLNSSTGWAGGFFTPSSGGMYKWNGSFTASVPDNASGADPVLYPNPASDIVHLSFPDSYNVRFYNAVGSLVKETQNNTLTGIAISDLPDGVYLIQSSDDPAVNLELIIHR